MIDLLDRMKREDEALDRVADEGYVENWSWDRESYKLAIAEITRLRAENDTLRAFKLTLERQRDDADARAEAAEAERDALRDIIPALKAIQ